MRTLSSRTRAGIAGCTLGLLALLAGLAPGVANAQESNLSSIGLFGGGGRLASFSTGAQGGLTALPNISGLNAGASLIGIDYRVQDDNLYGVSTDGFIYTIVPNTGQATLANTSRVPLDGSGSYGVDFNPVANALRIISAQGQNLRVPFATANAPTVVDTPLTRPVGSDPAVREPALGVTAAGYTNNVDGSTATQLLVLDTQRDQLGDQNPANAGTINPVGPLGVNFAAATAGYDIATAANSGFAVTGGSLYSVSNTGQATLIKRLGNVIDLAIPPNQG